MLHRESPVFSKGQPWKARSREEDRCQGSRSDPKGLSLTTIRDLTMDQQGVAGEKLKNPIFSQICVPKIGGDTPLIVT